MKKFVISILLAASLVNAGGYSIIEPLLKQAEAEITKIITEKMNGLILETTGIDNFFKTQIETKEANKEKIIDNITALKADTTLKLKEAAQQNDTIASLSALGTKINTLITEGRLKTLEEINVINAAEGGK
jgi:hypothetical protein